MKLLTVISLLLFIAYVGRSVCRFGVPKSLSDTFYLWEKVRRDFGMLFTSFCITLGTLMSIVMYDMMTGKWYQFLGVFAGLGLNFVGIAPHFRTWQKTVHVAGATTSAVASILAISLCGYWYVPAILLALQIIITGKWATRVFWSEMAAFVSTLGVVAYMVFK